MEIDQIMCCLSSFPATGLWWRANPSWMTGNKAFFASLFGTFSEFATSMPECFFRRYKVAQLWSESRQNSCFYSIRMSWKTTLKSCVIIHEPCNDLNANFSDMCQSVWFICWWIRRRKLYWWSSRWTRRCKAVNNLNHCIIRFVCYSHVEVLLASFKFTDNRYHII